MDMKMGVHLHQRLEQRMHLSQQMLQNLELLQLPIMDLRELILEELQENPTLDEKQDVEEEAAPAPEAPEETAEETARRESLESIEEHLYESERRTRRSDSAEDAERRLEMLNSVAEDSASLREHLQRQLALIELSAEVRAFCAHVVQAIDDNGYLTFSPEDLVASLPEEIRQEPPELLLQKIQHALSVIQGLEPRGVGARSIKECLLLQLDPRDARTPLLRKVIENHFEDLGANRLPKVARALALYPEARDFYGYEGEPDPERVVGDVKQLMGEIARLNPRPGSAYSSDRAPKVYPEVMIKQVDGKYEIVLEDGWLPSISINRNYEEMLRQKKLSKEERELVAPLLEGVALPAEERALLAEALKGRALAPPDRDRLLERVRDGAVTDRQRRILVDLLQERKLSREERDFLKSKMDMGRKLITAIEQRRGTIYRITSEILKRQMDFFEQGVEHLKPLKMQEVADAVGIHLSTVSRAISEKWVETPRGIFPLKFFFASAAPRSETSGGPGMPGALATADDPADERTRIALMERIREILDAEDKKNPLSDLEIMKILKDQHRITAARRTIAKYREEMNIPSSRLRKQY